MPHFCLPKKMFTSNVPEALEERKKYLKKTKKTRTKKQKKKKRKKEKERKGK